MTQTNKAGLEIVFRNPEPRREVQYSSTRLLCGECWEKVRRWRPFSIRSDWAKPHVQQPGRRCGGANEQQLLDARNR